MEAMSQIRNEFDELKSRVEALEQNGSTSGKLEAFSQQLSAVIAQKASRTVVPEPVPDERTIVAAGIVHRFSRVPLYLDGTILDNPRDIEEYNGKPLYYTLLRSASGIALAAFTERNAMIRESKNMIGVLAGGVTAFSEYICASPPDSLPEQVCFFEDSNQSGDVICLPPSRAYRDLTQVSRGFLGLSDWNDLISSVSWCRWDVSLYEHINYGGSELYLPAGCNTPNLQDLGWNDRASSIVNWGVRF